MHPKARAANKKAEGRCPQACLLLVEFGVCLGLVFEDELVVFDVDDDGFVLVDFLGKDVL